MRKTLYGLACVATTMACLAGYFFATPIYAEGETDNSGEQAIRVYGSGISVGPMSKIMQLAPSSVYEDTFTVNNDSDETVNFEAYVAPYSYMHSDVDDSYTLGFTNDNNYTQITRWTRIMDKNGNYVKRPQYTIDPHGKIDISYQVVTPDNIPAGGQYAVIFVHTLAEKTADVGINTETSPGMVIYGRAEGETIISGEISGLSMGQTVAKEDGEGKSVVLGHVNATAKVKNNGNIDFNATAILKVEGVFGGGYYETPENKARTSVIPESEITLYDEWEDTPWFGLYKATWTVTAAGETKSIEQVIFINPVPFIIISIILLTIAIIWITIVLRKRKERRARLSI